MTSFGAYLSCGEELHGICRNSQLSALFCRGFRFLEFYPAWGSTWNFALKSLRDLVVCPGSFSMAICAFSVLIRLTDNVRYLQYFATNAFLMIGYPFPFLPPHILIAQSLHESTMGEISTSNLVYKYTLGTSDWRKWLRINIQYWVIFK